MAVNLMMRRWFGPSIWEWAIFQRPPLLSTYKKEAPLSSFQQHTREEHKSKRRATPLMGLGCS
jgi:hypothetical protein